MDLSGLPHFLNLFRLDESLRAVLALLAGTAIGWTLTNWRDQQLRSRKLKVNRKA